MTHFLIEQFILSPAGLPPPDLPANVGGCRPPHANLRTGLKRHEIFGKWQGSKE